MADPSPPRIAELLRALIELLWHKPEGLYAREIIALLPRLMPPANDEREDIPAGDEADDERTLRLATVPLAQLGWMVKTGKGRWYLTEAGRQACRKVTNMQDLYKNALRQLEEERKVIPEAMIALETSEEIAWSQMEKYIQGKKPFEIQSMMAHLLRACGYHVIWVAPQAERNDRPDIVAWMDPIGAQKPRILVQIVHKGQAMTTEGIKTFSPILGENDFGVVLSTGGLTPDARQIVKSESMNLSLMDLEAFFDLWVLHYGKLDDEARKMFPLRPVYFLSF